MNVGEHPVQALRGRADWPRLSWLHNALESCGEVLRLNDNYMTTCRLRACPRSITTSKTPASSILLERGGLARGGGGEDQCVIDSSRSGTCSRGSKCINSVSKGLMRPDPG